jgi:hypothetical protein
MVQHSSGCAWSALAMSSHLPPSLVARAGWSAGATSDSRGSSPTAAMPPSPPLPICRALSARTCSMTWRSASGQAPSALGARHGSWPRRSFNAAVEGGTDGAKRRFHRTRPGAGQIRHTGLGRCRRRITPSLRPDLSWSVSGVAAVPVVAAVPAPEVVAAPVVAAAGAVSDQAARLTRAACARGRREAGWVGDCCAWLASRAAAATHRSE